MRVLLLAFCAIVSLPVHAFTGGVTTVTQPGGAGSSVVQTNVSRVKTPELDQTYQRTIRRAQTAVAARAAAINIIRRAGGSVLAVVTLVQLAQQLHGIWTKDAAGNNVMSGDFVDEHCIIGPSQYTNATNACQNNGWDYGLPVSRSVPTSCSLYYVCQGGRAEIYAGRLAAESVQVKNHQYTPDEWDKVVSDKVNLPRLLDDLDKAGQPVPFPEPDVEELPKPIVLPPTVTKNPDGSTRTEQTTLIPTQDTPGGPVTWRREVVTSTTSAPGPDGSTTTTPQGTTTSSTGLPPKADDSAPAVAPALPDVPELYKRAYPDGMVGVWSDHKDALSGSAFLGLLPKLFPAISADGFCPSMVLDLNISRWALFGVRDVAPPCWVWDFGKAVIIFSALLLARSLVFGG
jgi:hypothetical protein